MLITSYLTLLIKHSTSNRTRHIEDINEWLSVCVKRSSAGQFGHYVFLLNVWKWQVFWKQNKVIIEPKAFMLYWFFGDTVTSLLWLKKCRQSGCLSEWQIQSPTHVSECYSWVVQLDWILLVAQISGELTSFKLASICLKSTQVGSWSQNLNVVHKLLI